MTRQLLLTGTNDDELWVMQLYRILMGWKLSLIQVAQNASRWAWSHEQICGQPIPQDTTKGSIDFYRKFASRFNKLVPGGSSVGWGLLSRMTLSSYLILIATVQCSQVSFLPCTTYLQRCLAMILWLGSAMISLSLSYAQDTLVVISSDISPGWGTSQLR